MAVPAKIQWPEGKQFAFSIVDDTDSSTVEGIKPVYDFLIDHGILTTKTVWPLAPTRPRLLSGDTLEDPAYRDWVLGLRDRGVEIAMHGATDHSSTREEVIKGFDLYQSILGADPAIYINHAGQTESMYWGRDRLDGIPGLIYRLANALKRKERSYLGHVQGSPYFWGDVCRERITYMRNYIFDEINTLARDASMPYHDPARPYVPYWFSCSNGYKPVRFIELLSEKNQDVLAAQGGACIVYTHFGFRFSKNGKLDPEFTRLMERLARLPGWFVPASTLLDFLKTRPGWNKTVSPANLRSMQWHWLWCKFKKGTN